MAKAMTIKSDKLESQQLLILTPFGKDQIHLTKILSKEGHECVSCSGIEDLVSRLDEGVGAILTTEEVLGSPGAKKIIDVLARQPKWSAIPVIAFYSQNTSADPFQKKAAHPLHTLTDVTFLKRPVEAATLFSAVSAALRDRNRQYQIRELLLRLEEDIEHRKWHEKQLRKANEELEFSKNEALIANRAKSQFLANMSHEIRTPLGVIMGFLDLLKSEGSSVGDHASFMDVIERNSQQLLRLIDDILDLSKVEAGKISIERVNFSLVELLLTLSSALSLKAREKGIEFKLSLATSIPEVISSDQVRIRQILVNLIGNAIKFTSSGQVELVVSYQSPTLKFLVKDTGIGISAEQASNLFEPFRQADSSMTRKYGGTGLGLALSKRLAQALGGDLVLVESHLNQGSQFEASIMIKPIENVKMVNSDNLTGGFEKSNQPEDEKGRLSGLKVLLVEDSPDNRRLITTYLKKTGAQVSSAEDGHEGVKRALGESVDVVLMDVQMPRMDGHQAMRKLRSVGFSRPIIALTAHAMKEERDRCFESGCTDYLTKPISKTHLINVLSRYLPNH